MSMDTSDDVDRLTNELISKVRPRFESVEAAAAWFMSNPLPGFSGLTAAQLIQAGRAEEVLTYVEAVDAGVHT
jgi:hypothetical protein